MQHQEFLKLYLIDSEDCVAKSFDKIDWVGRGGRPFYCFEGNVILTQPFLDIGKRLVFKEKTEVHGKLAFLALSVSKQLVTG